ncbi:RICIN domain-containing protein [Streptomyces sp. NPDC101152]|uniref:RICIN domain-containing protein n=1 Tax=Streptomyces sp. NPDC101152 TaxID=3366116 RepID=UPI003816DB12
MGKIFRRLLLPAAALALSLTQAASAHADTTNRNLQTPWDGGQCLRPDLYWPLGQSVHEYSCSDGLAHHWQFAGPGGANTQIWWAPNRGCLIPNWDRLGSPVVVSGDRSGNVCNRSDALWTFSWLHGDYYKIKNVATGLVLDYDDSGAGRGLQLWNDLGDSNQAFSLNP